MNALLIMKYLVSIFLMALAAMPVYAETSSTTDIINRARATVGTESALEGLVTLQMLGRIEPSAAGLPDAAIMIVARKPTSQRLEVRMDDLVETTIVEGDHGCVVRTNLSQEGSQMRTLTDEELKRVTLNTRQLFSFYRPDAVRGEQVEYAGIEQRRGVRSHKLIYTLPDGMATTRYFSVTEHSLVSSVSDKGIETVAVGEQVVGGIRFPERVESYEGGTLLHTLVLTEVFANKPLPAGIFSIPRGEQK